MTAQGLGGLGEDSNIVLTGFMGTGKSTVGRLLAERLGFRFVDTDRVIEDLHGPIPTIFAERGEAAFRDMERAVATELAQERALVVATGGRMLLDEVNADALAATGKIFCLTATVEELVGRLTSENESGKRPLLDGPNPARRIAELLAERADGYGRFEQIATTGRRPEDITTEIIDAVKPSTTTPGRVQRGRGRFSRLVYWLRTLRDRDRRARGHAGDGDG